ncbi:hypothetical protein ACVIHI_000271 [Bradyrhizobium sp. USDA 4524]|nr:hypothetical protein [Bradyrhizobium sp. USDA 4538]MCP1898924.1 hypothetical protein [Bradyrhizobium sp. USDA 4537]MCP1986962.1 hypothetical protein [Bradyrhizobium sp. USDA 4539]
MSPDSSSATIAGHGTGEGEGPRDFGLTLHSNLSAAKGWRSDIIRPGAPSRDPRSGKVSCQGTDLREQSGSRSVSEFKGRPIGVSC